MTFTEAAAHVLRLVGKPLHYKEITDVAIERDLLSHVGKSPEVTMGARLAAGPPARERRAKLDVGRDPGAVAEPPQASLTPEAEETEADASGYPDLAGLDGEDDEDIGDGERARGERAAAATELFVPEEDDDEPILGGDLETETAE